MRFDLNKKPTKKERQQLKEINERLIKWIKETARYFPNATYASLFTCYKTISQNLKHLTKLLKLERYSDVGSYVWEALMAAWDEWYPMKDRKDTRTPQELLNYIRSIAWRKHNAGSLNEHEAESTIVFKDQDPLFKKTFKGMKEEYPNAYARGEQLVKRLPVEDADREEDYNQSTDIGEVELWISLEQRLAKDKTISPTRIKEIIDLTKARVAGITREDMHKYLGWDKQKAKAVWTYATRKIKKTDIL